MITSVSREGASFYVMVDCHFRGAVDRLEKRLTGQVAVKYLRRWIRAVSWGYRMPNQDQGPDTTVILSLRGSNSSRLGICLDLVALHSRGSGCAAQVGRGTPCTNLPTSQTCYL